MQTTYCASCRQNTGNKNARLMLKSTCLGCGNKKKLDLFQKIKDLVFYHS